MFVHFEVASSFKLGSPCSWLDSCWGIWNESCNVTRPSCSEQKLSYAYNPRPCSTDSCVLQFNTYLLVVCAGQAQLYSPDGNRFHLSTACDTGAFYQQRATYLPKVSQRSILLSRSSVPNSSVSGCEGLATFNGVPATFNVGPATLNIVTLLNGDLGKRPRQTRLGIKVEAGRILDEGDYPPLQPPTYNKAESSTHPSHPTPPGPPYCDLFHSECHFTLAKPYTCLLCLSTIRALSHLSKTQEPKSRFLSCLAFSGSPTIQNCAKAHGGLLVFVK